MSNDRPREWLGIAPSGNKEILISVMEPDSFRALRGTNPHPEEIRLIEYADYESVVKERDAFELALQRESRNSAAECAELRAERDETKSELEKTKYALEQTNNGRPSEWAYSILRKDRDAERVKNVKLVEALEQISKIRTLPLTDLNDTDGECASQYSSVIDTLVHIASEALNSTTKSE